MDREFPLRLEGHCIRKSRRADKGNEMRFHRGFSLAIDPITPNIGYAGGREEGLFTYKLFKTRDAGSRWASGIREGVRESAT